ncbi:MAG: metal-dependent hydrolase, partial [Planctomycetaceae bacterium]|nr:metal-dependent hydrolase [Planctomycetaceae bacterium]
MTTTVTWLGHGSWSIKTENGTILLDPFLDDSPTAPVKAADVEADYILVSHGHFDHVADVAAIANRTGATVAAVVEIGQWFQDQHGVENTIQMNLGGGVTLPFGHLKMTLAHHSSQLPDGTYGGNPAGFLLTIEGKKIYFACDTALFL